ncbi:MAG: LysR family transcriptional regulator [Alphaproteobacteria bacterium]|jgi:LysR family transcriptional regulator, low CO2-responsive transcriptional regulator|nr:LysR family transcriptional regulator [Alphaproteobacteria bacterium]MBU1547972.1 LysR family transcriptional regulator [Alphaproteobacteria bacterium]MBU2336266.1 LysR family transcriptional regulator [Alphaproteobacteria bacterium]MBU2390339.1 LysR family transcriptional regulator [Alphaproteobacteria bacterium]MDY6960467.1 LysR substrate-binding domain-containing protein [Pseudomonadota bacterium]
MNYAQIRAFYSVVREGGVGRAAKFLNVSQPTVSQHLRALEETAAVPLFERRGRGLALTPEGARLFAAAEHLMRAVAAVEDSLATPGELERGRLRIVSDSPPVVVQLLKRFRDRHQAVTISTALASKAQIMAEIADGEADFGITVDPTVGVDYTAIPLRSDGLSLCVWRGHPLARKRRVELMDLAPEVLLLREPGSRTRNLLQQAMNQRDVTPREAIEIGSREVLREAVALEIGVTVFTASECPPDPRLAYVPIHEPGLMIVVHEHLVFRKRTLIRPEMAALIEIARDYSAEQAGQRMATASARSG